MSVFVLARYLVDVRDGVHRLRLTACGEDELAALTRILARSGVDFDVRAEHNQERDPASGPVGDHRTAESSLETAAPASNQERDPASGPLREHGRGLLADLEAHNQEREP